MPSTAPHSRDVDDVTSVVISVPATAPPVQVWDVLVNRTAEWWGDPYVASATGPMRLEPRLGGRVWTGSADASSGDLHGTIRTFDPPHRLEIGGVLVPGAYAGAIVIEVEKTALGCEIHVEQSARGRIEAATEERMSDGWSQLATRLAELSER